MTSKKLKALGQLILFIVGIELIGGLSGLLAGDIKGIYNNLKLPPLAPPDYLFGIVWPVLYALIAISAYLIFYKLKTKCFILFWNTTYLKLYLEYYFFQRLFLVRSYYYSLTRFYCLSLHH